MRIITCSVATALAAASLAGCDKAKPRPPSAQPAAPSAAATPAGAPAAWTPPPPKPTNDPLPAQAAWAGALLGKSQKVAFPRADGNCIGNTDRVDLRYVGATPGVMIEGWGWDKDAKQVVARVVLADKDGQIVGGGESGVPRPDVPAAEPFVTSSTSGWKAVTPVTTGVLLAYGIVGEGRTCALGQIDLGH